MDFLFFRQPEKNNQQCVLSMFVYENFGTIGRAQKGQ